MTHKTTRTHRSRRILVWTAVALAVLFTGCPQNPFFGLQPNPRDEEGPEVTIINPEDGQALSGLLVVTGVTADKYEVEQVSVTVGSRPAEVLEGTYSWYYTLDTAELGAGTYPIVVTAVDEFGNVGEESVTITVDQDVPSVEFPYDPTLYENHFSGTDLTLTGTADDNTEVVRVQISLDGGLTFNEASVSPSGGSWSWSYTIADTDSVKPGDGDVTLVLRVYDDAGLIGTTSQIVYFDNTAPAATIATPANDVTIDSSADLTGDSLVVSGTASDGGPFGVGSIDVELRQLGALLHSETIDATDSDGIQDYSQSFYLPDVGSGAEDIRNNGPITVNVIATDRAGNTFTETVNVSLDDDPPAFSGTIDRDGVGALDGDLSQPVNNFASASQIISGTVTSPEGVDNLYVEVKAGATENGDSIFPYELVDNPDDGALADGEVKDPSGDWSYTLDPERFPSDGDFYLTFRVTKTDKGFERVSKQIRIDRVAPTVAVNTPGDGAQVAGTNVSVSGQVGGTGGDVQFIDLVITDDVSGAADDYVNTRFSAPDFTSASPADDSATHDTYGAYADLDYASGGFAWQWDTTEYSVSVDIAIEMTVTDMAGNVASSTVTVQKDRDAPTASFSTYSLDSYSDALIPGRYINGSGTIGGSASATNGVDAVRISSDGTNYTDATLMGTPVYSWTYDLPGLAAGPQTLYLEVTDGTATNTISIGVQVDNDEPVMGPLSIDLQDGSGTDHYHGTVLVSGTSSDATSDIESVVVTIDGVDLAGVSGTSAYSGEWDTETLPTITRDGVVVEATAIDLAGNTTTVSPADAVNVRPYVYSVSKDEAYLGETGLVVYGNNLGANGDFAGVTLTVGDGAADPTALDATLSPNELTFTVPAAADPFPSPYTGPRSGRVGVEYGGLSNEAQDAVKMDLFDIEQVTDVGTPTYPGAVFHDGGTNRAVYAYAGSQGNNRFVYFVNGTAVPVEVFAGDAPADGTAMYTEIAGAPGGSDRLYVLYRLEKQGVFVATSNDNFSTSTEQTIAAASASFADIAVSGDGGAHVVYYDSGDLFYRYSDDEFATVEPVETVDGRATDAGQWVAIATDSSDRPHVVYQDATADSLMYAYRTSGGTWTTPAAIDSSSAGSLGTAIAIDSADGIHVAYYNGDAGDLRYAHASGAGGPFTTQTVDSQGITGWFPSIAIDANDDPHITYATFGSTPKPKYARMTSEGFVSVFIAEDGTYDINNNTNSTATIVDDQGIVSMIYTTTAPALQRARYLPEP